MHRKEATPMTSTEAMIYQLKNLKGKPLKQKLEHIFTYFWIPIVVVLAVLGFTVSYIVHIATMKDTALSVICLNSYVERDKTDTYTQEFAEKAGIDLEEYEIQLSTDLTVSDSDMAGSYESVQVLMAQIAAQSVDVMAADLANLTRYFYQDTFFDLREILSPEQQAAYGEYFLYADMAVARVFQESVEPITEFPDPTKPETMAEPVPVALLLPEDNAFRSLCYPYTKGDVALAVVINSPNIPNALAFVDHIME